MKEISVQDIQQIGIGQVEKAGAGTGCTALVCPEGMRAGLDVRGGGPASRESQLLNPLMAGRGQRLRSRHRRRGHAASGGARHRL